MFESLKHWSCEIYTILLSTYLGTTYLFLLFTLVVKTCLISTSPPYSEVMIFGYVSDYGFFYYLTLKRTILVIIQIYVIVVLSNRCNRKHLKIMYPVCISSWKKCLHQRRMFQIRNSSYLFVHHVSDIVNCNGISLSTYKLESVEILNIIK